MRREREDELDLADVGGEADTTTHNPKIAFDRWRPKGAGTGPPSCIPHPELIENTDEENLKSGLRRMFFVFPEDARWDADRQAVAFGVEIGEYQGVVRVPRRVFQRLLPDRPTPERVAHMLAPDWRGRS
jgi:hypothetical protein